MSQSMPALAANQQFCRSCGQIISSLAPACPHCGAPTGNRNFPANASPKSRLAALLLCGLLPFVFICGAQRFYVGKIGTGILQLVTFGCLGIWQLIDLILIIVGVFKDKEDRPVVIWTE